MINKFILTVVIFMSVLYSIGCCGVAGPYNCGSTVRVTFTDGSYQDIVASGDDPGGRCYVTFTCDKELESAVTLEMPTED